MPEDDSTKPRAIERWIEVQLPEYRFGLVLTLLLTTYVFMASGVSGGWVRVVTVTLQGLTLLAALRASQVSRRLFRIAGARRRACARRVAGLPPLRPGQ